METHTMLIFITMAPGRMIICGYFQQNGPFPNNGELIKCVVFWEKQKQKGVSIIGLYDDY